MEIGEDDVVLCTVKRIEGTTVLLEIDGEADAHASMVLSEVAAGRIRNLRDYVSVGRKIVCKVLKINGEHVELSLRRVTGREREEMMENLKREKTLKNILKGVVDDVGSVVGKIKEEYDLSDFFDEVREGGVVVLERFVGKANAEKLAKVFAEKGSKVRVVARKFSLRSLGDEGVEDIKYVLDSQDGGEVHYLGNSKFSLEVSGEDFKEVNLKVEEIIAGIEKKAGEKKVLFELAKGGK